MSHPVGVLTLRVRRDRGFELPRMLQATHHHGRVGGWDSAAPAPLVHARNHLDELADLLMELSDVAIFDVQVPERARRVGRKMAGTPGGRAAASGQRRMSTTEGRMATGRRAMTSTFTLRGTSSDTSNRRRNQRAWRSGYNFLRPPLARTSGHLRPHSCQPVPPPSTAQHPKSNRAKGRIVQ